MSRAGIPALLCRVLPQGWQKRDATGQAGIGLSRNQSVPLYLRRQRPTSTFLLISVKLVVDTRNCKPRRLHGIRTAIENVELLELLFKYKFRRKICYYLLQCFSAIFVYIRRSHLTIRCIKRLNLSLCAQSYRSVHPQVLVTPSASSYFVVFWFWRHLAMFREKISTNDLSA